MKKCKIELNFIEIGVIIISMVATAYLTIMVIFFTFGVDKVCFEESNIIISSIESIMGLTSLFYLIRILWFCVIPEQKAKEVQK